MKNNFKIALYIILAVISLGMFIVGGFLFVEQENILCLLWSTISISVAASLLAGVITAFLIDLTIFLKNEKDIENEKSLFFENNKIRLINLGIQAINFSNDSFIPTIKALSQDERLVDLIKRKVEKINNVQHLYNEDDDITLKSELEGKIAYLNESLKTNLDIFIRSKNITIMFSNKEFDCLKNALWICEQIKSVPTATSIIIGIHQLLCITLMHLKETSNIMGMTIQEINDSGILIDIP